MLKAMGFPISNEALVILPAEWLIDRMRTAVNVFGNMIAIPIVTNRCRKMLAKTSERDESRLLSSHACNCQTYQLTERVRFMESVQDEEQNQSDDP